MTILGLLSCTFPFILASSDGESVDLIYLQEYVDHSSLIYKFYALGAKVFYAVKKSTPSADTLMNLFADKGLKPLHFDRYYILKDNCRTYHGVWGKFQKKRTHKV